MAATVANYTSTDKNAANGKNYYRLKMVDKDGNFEYSKVIVVIHNRCRQALQ